MTAKPPIEKRNNIIPLRPGEEPLIGDKLLQGKPKANCRRCFGTGWMGKNLKTGVMIPCVCTKPIVVRKG